MRLHESMNGSSAALAAGDSTVGAEYTSPGRRTRVAVLLRRIEQQLQVVQFQGGPTVTHVLASALITPADADMDLLPHTVAVEVDRRLR